MTPHIRANYEDIAKVVIMPGDPLRAKYIADNFLRDYKLVNDVRNMYAYTGYYKDKLVTIFASGMGNASMGIYSYELYKYYGVEKIIRVGTCGAYTPKLNLKDIILANQVISYSTFNLLLNEDKDNVLLPSKDLNQKISNKAKEKNINLNVGTIYSTDVFYSNIELYELLHKKYGCLGVEMESFALCANAKLLNKECAILLSVSDSFYKEEKLTSKEREVSLNTMIELALEVL